MVEPNPESAEGERGPAEGERLAEPPQPNEGEPAALDAHRNPITQGEEANRKLSGDKYRLKAPVFTGNEDVEQFIQEFGDVVGFSQWPPRVARSQLRLMLTDTAKLYGLGTDVDSIFAALRTRFGLLTIDARVRLHGLQHDARTLLQEHSATVTWLAQVAYR